MTTETTTPELTDSMYALLFRLHEDTPTYVFWRTGENFLSASLEYATRSGNQRASFVFESIAQRNELLVGMEYEGYFAQPSTIGGITFKHDAFRVPARVWETIFMTKRFESVEDARETLSYIDEDLAEVSGFIQADNRVMALNILEKMIADCDAAAHQFPEMEAELKVIVTKITPYLQVIIAKA